MKFSARVLPCLMVTLAFFILDACQASDTLLGVEECPQASSTPSCTSNPGRTEEASKSPSLSRHELAQELVQKYGALDFFKQTCSGLTATSFNDDGKETSLKVHIDFERRVQDLTVLYENSFDEAGLREMVSMVSYNMKIDKENPVHMKIDNTLIAFQRINLYRPGMSPLGIYLTLSKEEMPDSSALQKEKIQDKEKISEKS